MSPTSEPRLSRDRIEALFAKMARSRVVVVGDAMLDIYLAGEAERISPEAPVPVVTVQGRRHALGGAANVATNVAAIGGEARLVAVIGTTPAATRCGASSPPTTSPTATSSPSRRGRRRRRRA